MNDEKQRKLGELEAEAREQDEAAARAEAEHLAALIDLKLEPLADEMAEEIGRLAEQLYDLEIISEEDPGRLEMNAALGIYGIEADHPDDGARLYTRTGEDTIVATRMRKDGRYEHAVLDEYGLPLEWRTVHRPDLN